jgi:hypothetical protein
MFYYSPAAMADKWYKLEGVGDTITSYFININNFRYSKDTTRPHFIYFWLLEKSTLNSTQKAVITENFAHYKLNCYTNETYLLEFDYYKNDKVIKEAQYGENSLIQVPPGSNLKSITYNLCNPQASPWHLPY